MIVFFILFNLFLFAISSQASVSLQKFSVSDGKGTALKKQHWVSDDLKAS